MKARLLLLWVLVCGIYSGYAQEEVTRRKPTAAEISSLKTQHDSLIREMRRLYQLEKKSGTTGQYQPERVACVRQYLMLFMHIERTVSLVAYRERDITGIFGRPDLAEYPKSYPGRLILFYTSVNKKFIYIDRLNYRFIFDKHVLVKVERGQ